MAQHISYDCTIVIYAIIGNDRIIEWSYKIHIKETMRKTEQKTSPIHPRVQISSTLI